MCSEGLHRYRELINRMPVDEQTTVASIETWTNRLGTKGLDDLLSSLGPSCKCEGNGTIEISRADLFRLREKDVPISQRLIYAVFIWGYPRGGRGNNFVNMVRRIETIEQILANAKKAMCQDDVNELSAGLHGCGIGLSTWSKLLYFGGLKVGNHDALILDSKIINVFQRRLFKEFDELNRIRDPKQTGITYGSGPTHYETYLRVMSERAGELGVKPAQLEMFLFLFGDSLKGHC